MKVLIYNADGLSLPVEVEVGVPFKFTCKEGECGKRIVIEGIVRPASEEEFNEVLEKTVSSNPGFKRIREITARRLVFEGKVNGKPALLPVESLDDFAERFMSEVLVLR
ncbi:hypothetical protein A3L12_00890 [Thermococcus sp. P6]|uniref:hypothetical protein n=1 Tax=Thermococcus sp. P6 TaxID=122420 RepID=UPI000B598A05|nr:hypothetical protein [Thermococcus sp. P6]ASJ09955.1 hypothetical protein A3L12_00890 [Thermococcus sp. P6]